ncbi:MAG TPA: hypothetical protein VGF97_14375 [Rhizomicrobium sp.]|jgi:hypothetical protein
MNEIPWNADAELSLQPDFAARVIRKAEAVAQWRRGARAFAAIALLTVGIVAGWTLQSPGISTVVTNDPTQSLNGDLAWVSAMNDSDRGDTLAYLFPDAAPVADFQSRYAAPVAADGVQGAVSVPEGMSDDTRSP